MTPPRCWRHTSRKCPGECDYLTERYDCMKALTVWQPWASLIACGAKPFEFRGHRLTHGQIGKRIAIHAGARPAKRQELVALRMKLLSESWRESGLLRDAALACLDAHRSFGFPLASVLCTAILGTPIRDDALAIKLDLPYPVNDSDRDDHSNWGWPLTEIEPLLPPAPARGMQGMWEWSDAR